MRGAPWTIMLLAALLAAPAFGDDGGASSWLDSEPRARPYDAVRQDILKIFDEAAQAPLPVALLMEKLKEGVSKRVPADVLLAALRAEQNRLSVAWDLVDRQDGAIQPGGREEAVRRIDLLLVAETAPTTIESVLDAAASARRTSSDAVEALGVLAQVKLSMELTDPLLKTLGTAMLRSRMGAGVFGSVLTVLVQARTRGMSTDAAVAMVTGVLASGGGITQRQDRLQQLATAGPAATGKPTIPGPEAGAPQAVGTQGGPHAPGGHPAGRR